MRATSDPPLTLAEAARRGVPRVRLVCAKCAGAETMPSAGCAGPSARRRSSKSARRSRPIAIGAARETQPTIAGLFSSGEVNDE
jgi:hypothetical protein